MRDIPDQDRRQKESWHVDKRVNVSLIVFLAVQTIAIALYMGHQDQKITDVVQKQDTMEKWKDSQSETSLKNETRLAVIEERTKDQGDTLRRIDARLESVLVPRAPR